MPRLTPKRAQTPEPLSIPFDAVAGRLRTRETFTCEGVLFQKGDIVDGKSELVQAILNDYPSMFELANLWR